MHALTGGGLVDLRPGHLRAAKAWRAASGGAAVAAEAQGGYSSCWHLQRLLTSCSMSAIFCRMLMAAGCLRVQAIEPQKLDRMAPEFVPVATVRGAACDVAQVICGQKPNSIRGCDQAFGGGVLSAGSEALSQRSKTTTACGLATEYTIYFLTDRI
jgi:hypothetical protein